MRGFLPRTVIVLGLVSFLNDTASEMITLLLPLFLTATLGAGLPLYGVRQYWEQNTCNLVLQLGMKTNFKYELISSAC